MKSHDPDHLNIQFLNHDTWKVYVDKSYRKYEPNAIFIFKKNSKGGMN